MTPNRPDKPNDQQPRSHAISGDQTVEAGSSFGKRMADQEPTFDLKGERAHEIILGDYVLLERIGAGGMGQVYKAQHRRMDRIVALKVLPRTTMRDPDAVQRFHREMRAAAKLFHPNIVTALDAGEQDGVHYLVMEYVEGQPLTRVVEARGALPPEEAVYYILQAAQGLQYAHARHVMHRDVKPSNLILTPEGTIKILDMGTARIRDAISGEGSWEDNTVAPVGLTHSGVIIGTVDYMAPEQARDARSADHRADIYSLGCTLYYLLTGRPVYSGDLIQTLLAHAQQPVPSLRKARQDVPEALDIVFQRMLAKDPQGRYQSMVELMAHLEDCGLALPAMQSPGTVNRSYQMAASLQKDRRREPRRASLTAKILPIGIDLGTSFTSIAHVDRAAKVERLAMADGQLHVPTVVSIAGMDIRIGSAALEALESQEVSVAYGMKRYLGRGLFYNPEDGRHYPPEALLALVLNKVASDARSHLGNFHHVSISVPASFDDVRRKAVQDAAYIAGLEVLHICNEPMAAALAHVHQQRQSGTEESAASTRLLVLHLGAGTCDASVVEIAGTNVTAVVNRGDTLLGGRDWDERLVDMVAGEFAERHKVDPRSDAPAMERLYRTCEQAKLRLTSRSQTTLNFQMGRRGLRAVLTREKLKEVSRDLVKRVRTIIDEALAAAGTAPGDLGKVLLSGGATRTAGIPEMLHDLFEGQVELVWLKREAVVQGTALLAASRLTSDSPLPHPYQVQEVSSNSLGLIGIDPTTGAKHNAILIPRYTQLPVTTQRVFKTQKEGQKTVVLHIIQGESDAPEKCIPLGKCAIDHLPEDLPAGSPVTVEFHYSASGRLTVFVESPAGMRRATKEITRASGLSSDELWRWRQWAETMVLCSTG